jgi:hypothetical protein
MENRLYIPFEEETPAQVDLRHKAIALVGVDADDPDDGPVWTTDGRLAFLPDHATKLVEQRS